MLTPELPGTGGVLRSRPEDFVVDEVPAYLPEGEGEHLMLRVEKRSLNTDDVARAIAARVGCSPQEVGFAGRKDRDAVTRQWFTAPAKGDAAAVASLDLEGTRVLEVSRHRNKLRTGHLRGNRFEIVIRDVHADALSRARAIVERIEREGLPNGFGPQRFGRGGRNVEMALGWIAGGRRPPRQRSRRKLLVSALQAMLFNRVVARRLEATGSIELLDGDICKKHDTGGLFVATGDEATAARVRSREISPTGPIYGAKMWWPEREALRLEEAVLAAAGLDRDVLDRFKKDGKGSRRPLRVFPEELEVGLVEGGLRVAFQLEAGAFATTLLAEITKNEELAPPVG